MIIINVANLIDASSELRDIRGSSMEATGDGLDCSSEKGRLEGELT
jgi:hypothetical protein